MLDPGALEYETDGYVKNYEILRWNFEEKGSLGSEKQGHWV